MAAAAALGQFDFRRAVEEARVPAAGGTIARYFIGLTQGKHFGAEITAEAVRDEWATVNDEEGYIVPSGPGDEFGKLMKMWQA